MNFLNLGLPELLALGAAASSAVVLLYLLSRARQRLRVPTLRFWRGAAGENTARQRRRIQQPLSMLLQIVGLLLLVLAIAQPRFGGFGAPQRDHVLLLDTSSWMAAGEGGTTLLDRAKAQALAWLDRLPAGDRVMVVRAGGVTVPATDMTDDRDAAREAVRRSRPGASALHLGEAFAFAAQVRRNGGEIVYAGAGRTAGQGAVEAPQGTRALLAAGEPDNRGIHRVAVRRAGSGWQVFVSVRNHGRRPADTPLVVRFGGAQIGGRRVILPPGAEQEWTFPLDTRAAGWLEARIGGRDALADDDRAIVEIPEQRPVRVAVYSDQPEVWRALLGALPGVEAEYSGAAAWSGKTGAAAVVLDRVRSAQDPQTPALWLRPDSGHSTVRDAVVTRWNAAHDLAAGLQASAVRLPQATVLTRGSGDEVVAEIASGPVMLARTQPVRTVLLGYSPAETRAQLATPLLFANVLRWLVPATAQAQEIRAETAGLVTAPLLPGEDGASLRLLDDRARPLPFAVRGREVEFFSAEPGIVRLRGPGGERVWSLSLPDVGGSTWEPAAGVPRSLPRRASVAAQWEVWPALAAAGAAVLALEWLLYGRARRRAGAPHGVPEWLRLRRAA